MILFWLVCVVLLIVALAFVVWPLWRKSGSDNGVLRDAANLEILRDQSAELEADLQNGLLTQEAYEQGKRELQARLLDEVKTMQTVILPRNPPRVLALVLAVLLPLFSVPLYLKLGSSDALLMDGSSAGMASEAMLRELEKKVERQPDDPNELVTLARAYIESGRFQAAVKAYKKLSEMVPDEPQVWVEYAKAYALNNDGSLLGEPEKFIDKALALDGNNGWALGLSGSAAMQRADYVAAITQWQKLTGLLPPDNAEIQAIRDGISRARELLAQQNGGKEKMAQLPKDNEPAKAVPNPDAAITGKVALSGSLAGKVSPEDTVFILARAAEGPKMPLAVLRAQVKDLPMQFMLDDSMAMQPQLKLSGFDRVVVVARVSKSGSPIGQSGDLQGMTKTIKPGSRDLNIVIDAVLP